MLGHDVLAALPDLRSHAESLMVDSCVIRARTGRATDPVTGEVADTYGDPVYSGKCRMQSRDALARTTEVGPVLVEVMRREVHIPVGTGSGVAVGHVVDYTSTRNPVLNGTYRVTDLGPDKTHGTARRLVVESP